MITKCPIESKEALALKQWADYHPIAKHYLAPIPNGGSRNKLEAINMRRRGQVRAGVSDYFLAYPKNKQIWDEELCALLTVQYHGLWIELKRQNKTISKVTPEQQEWLYRMANIGYFTLIAYGAQEAIQGIQDYLT